MVNSPWIQNLREKNVTINPSAHTYVTFADPAHIILSKKATESSRNLAQDEADLSDTVDWPKKITPAAIQQLISIKQSQAPSHTQTRPFKGFNKLTSSSHPKKHVVHKHVLVKCFATPDIQSFSGLLSELYN